MIALCPLTLRAAREFIGAHHRHNDPPSGHKLSIGLTENGRLVGAVVLAQPIARKQCDGYTAEITRCCVLPGIKNANSRLYAAALRAARAMGYRRVLTYTLPSESGASLRAVGFVLDGMTRYNKNGWNSPSRERKAQRPDLAVPKNRWVKEF